MKKQVIIVFALLLVSFIGWLGYSSIAKLKSKEAIKESQQLLASTFSSLGISSSEVDQTTVLIYFNSECEHCQWELEEISKNIAAFSETRIALVSHEPTEEAQSFLSKYGLEEFYLNSPADKVMSAFAGGVPQIFIYKNGELSTHFRGEVKVGLLINALRK